MGQTEPSAQSPESRLRRRIRRAAEARGLRIELIEWEPIRNGSEMQGAAGGWTVMFENADHVLGYTWQEVVEQIEETVADDA